MNRIQAAKDSLYVALRDRLESVNPGRIAQIGRTTRIAMEAALGSDADKALPGVFYLSFGAVEAVANASAPGSAMVKVHCAATYGVASTAHQEADASEMDAELIAAMMPTSTGLMDYSQVAPVVLGERVFWTMPVVVVKSGLRMAEFVLFV